jgi:hypothetical protein
MAPAVVRPERNLGVLLPQWGFVVTANGMPAALDGQVFQGVWAPVV